MPHDPERGRRIAALRGHIPQPVIADKVGVTLRAYQEYEYGGGIAWENLTKLARIFKVSVDYIVAGPAEPAEPSQLDRLEARLDEVAQRINELQEAFAPRWADYVAQAVEDAVEKVLADRSEHGRDTNER